jgi:hypothetical protein
MVFGGGIRKGAVRFEGFRAPPFKLPSESLERDSEAFRTDTSRNGAAAVLSVALQPLMPRLYEVPNTRPRREISATGHKEYCKSGMTTGWTMLCVVEGAISAQSLVSAEKAKTAALPGFSFHKVFEQKAFGRRAGEVHGGIRPYGQQ